MKKLSSDIDAVILVCTLLPGFRTTLPHSATTVASTGLYEPLIVDSTVPLISLEDDPISNTYFPGSKVILPFTLSQNHRSEQSMLIATDFVWPAATVTLWNPFNLFIGLSSDAGLSGVFKYT